MQLNTNGRLAQFYRWTYDRKCPNDLCTFFWKLLFATVVFPITWLTYPWDLDHVAKRVFAGIAMWVGLLAVAGIASVTLGGDLFFVYIIGGLAAIAVGCVLLVGTGVGAVAGVGFGYRKVVESEIVQVVVERKRAFKDNYCPRIDWK